MTNTPNTLRFSPFYLFSRTNDSVKWMTMPLYDDVQGHSRAQNTKLQILNNTRNFFLLPVLGLCHSWPWSQAQTSDFRPLSRSVNFVFSGSVESLLTWNWAFWKYPEKPFTPTFSSSTSTSSRLFAIMLIRSAKLSFSMHSPRCFTTSQSGKVSLWKEIYFVELLSIWWLSLKV